MSALSADMLCGRLSLTVYHVIAQAVIARDVCHFLEASDVSDL